MSAKCALWGLTLFSLAWLLAPEANGPSFLPTAAFTAEAIPQRRANAMTASQFREWIREMSPDSREKAVLTELIEGNIPPFLRHLKPVVLTYQPPFGKRSDAIIWVMPDYLSIGPDDDFVRMPMGLPTALAVARRYGFTLPTRKMVDFIYRQADFRLIPEPMTPGFRMSSSEYFWEHNQLIERQRRGRPLGELLSGQKKDLVLTNRLVKKARRVAIYGWHRPSGIPIQPLSTVHRARNADYSHGVRLVSATVLVNGVRRSVFEVLRDPNLAMLLSYEGVIRDAERLLALDLEPASKGQVAARDSIQRKAGQR
jgi:hypothetical protein